MDEGKNRQEVSCCIGCNTGKSHLENVEKLRRSCWCPPPAPKQPETDGSSDEGDEIVSPVSSRTRGQRPVVLAPLREAVGPEGTPVYVHVPFPTADLLNWKQAVGSCQNNPEGTYSTVKRVVITRHPNWGDAQALLEFLFTTEERRTVLERAKEELSWGEEGLPNADPIRVRVEDYRGQREYQKLILHGIQHGVPKHKN